MQNFNIEETIAIDLGTTNTCVLYYYKNEIKLLDLNPGKEVFPSVVAVRGTQTFVGKPATLQRNKVFELKRMIGRKFDDPVVKQCMEIWPFEVVQNERGLPAAKITEERGDILISPLDFYVYIIKHVAQAVSEKIGRQVVNVVMTVPAYFGEHQRRATEAAAKRAGLNVIYLINEPTAACIAYGARNNLCGKKILVYDLGGGTFDVSILEVTEDNVFKVLSSVGDPKLGGMDFTNCLYEEVEKMVRMQHPEAISDTTKMAKLRAEVDKIKIHLSIDEETEIDLSVVDDDWEDEFIPITRDFFESITVHLVNKTKLIVEESYRQINLVPADIDKVVMIGGGSNMPCVRRAMQELFGSDCIMTDVNPDSAVARGALTFVMINSGIEVPGSWMKPARISNAQPEIFSPEEVGMQQYLKQTSIMNENLKIQDICPMCYVVRVRENEVDELVPRNCSLPFNTSKTYTTTVDNATIIYIDIAQGNSPNFFENDFFARLALRNIPPRPMGEVKVKMDINVNQFCQVSFKAWYNGIPATFTEAKDIEDPRMYEYFESTQQNQQNEIRDISEHQENKEVAKLRAKCEEQLEHLEQSLQVNPSPEWMDYYVKVRDFIQREGVTKQDLEQILSTLSIYINAY